MRFVTFRAPKRSPGPGILTGKGILPLPYADMLTYLQSGESLRATGQRLANANDKDFSPLADAQLLAPIPRPASLRDFYAFEQHVRTAHTNRGRTVPTAWYEMPVFYYTNPGTIFGPDETIPYPEYTAALDYELEIGCVIGKTGRDIPAEKAEEYIFGYTILNDWSARDEQRKEMGVGLGPAKGKDFATSLGPWIITPDDLLEYKTSRAGVYDLKMTARVNGELRSEGNFHEIYYSLGEMIERASQAVFLYPGDVLGSGTVGSGCLLELTRGEGPWLQPGDVVELEIEQLGVLRNTVGLTNKPDEKVG
jgi:2-keto-4-pentenoate hydratase/2-oxohepta-3-ene-1,7-dioic acid hydratase in catechol pathway